MQGNIAPKANVWGDVKDAVSSASISSMNTMCQYEVLPAASVHSAFIPRRDSWDENQVGVMDPAEFCAAQMHRPSEQTPMPGRMHGDCQVSAFLWAPLGSVLKTTSYHCTGSNGWPPGENRTASGPHLPICSEPSPRGPTWSFPMPDLRARNTAPESQPQGNLRPQARRHCYSSRSQKGSI
ncbi:uncharacterized protein LOC118177296 isoform X2 [Oxyura jamaicensis]|uniref:uncharacterized protein LOC118177296 isoform X2 n=1 Tax=Oxyura jamaicensis TaxID=8884 RepID=UPI0015A5CC55|nr:uncharacterized protein LOC118177296 isoform X2 [Oxyura jamaicensis]